MTLLNIPNILTLSRIFLVPLVMVFMLVRMEYGDYIAAGFFILAALTDTADGYIARKWGMVTKLGKLIDPLADKILVSAALVSLVELGRLPAWIVVVIIAREFMVTGIRLVAASEGIVISASMLGKLKTVSQVIAIAIVILNLPFGRTAMFIAMILTVWSGADYIIEAKQIILSQ